MKTALTKAEKKYIVDMYVDTIPNIKDIKDIKDMPLGCAGLFLENREDDPAKKWFLDHSISEKYLTAHGLPINMTYDQWMTWLKKKEKTFIVKTKKKYPTLIKL